MGWHDVSDQQLDLYRWWNSDRGRDIAKGFGESMRRTELEVNGFDILGSQLESTIAQVEASKMYLGDPVYVDPEMMTLIESAGELFQPEPLQESDLLTQIGFVSLPRPMFMIDRHAKRVSFRAFAWMPLEFRNEGADEATANGIHLSLYSHVDDIVDGLDDYPPEQSGFTPEQIRQMWSRMGTPYNLAHVTPWTFGGDLPEGMRDLAASWWKPIQAFLRLTMQTVGERYQQQAPRAARKRWQREGKPKEDRYITVIRLRRPRGHRDGEASTVEWQQRWIVNGHWRNQWFPSLALHRQIWIGAYVKGPESKPLLIRKGRAFEFVR